MKDWGYFNEFGAIDVEYGSPVMQFILSKEFDWQYYGGKHGLQS